MSNDSNARPSRRLPALCLVLAAAAAASLPAAANDAAPRDARGAAPDFNAGGAYAPPEHGEHLSPQFRQRAWAEIRSNARKLKLTAAPQRDGARSLGGFAWPMAGNNGLADPGYHAISNYVDQAGSGQILDYSCGARSYDGHRGTDYYLWPFSWHKMDNSQVKVIAAAPGTIVGRSDGNFDRSCSVNNNNWNAVYVQHADGSVAWYGHMKNGSLTSKQVGAMVAAGEFLGIVGSSGNSTGPHLHFEVHTAAFDLVEPWFGPCNNLNPDTWWQSQRPYLDSALNRFTTGDGSPLEDTCPSAELPHEQATFLAGATVYFTAYYRDQVQGQLSHYSILRPDASVFSSWDHASDQTYAASYWWFSVTIPSTEPAGIWKFKIDYDGDSFDRPFTMGSPGACGRVPEYPAQGELLKLEKISTSYRLLWGASCNAKDTDYVIYEGTMGNFTTSAPVRCTTSGNRAALFSASATSRFYLVGPRNGTREGSLGTDSTGSERPPGTTSCVARFVLQCP